MYDIVYHGPKINIPLYIYKLLLIARTVEATDEKIQHYYQTMYRSDAEFFEPLLLNYL